MKLLKKMTAYMCVLSMAAGMLATAPADVSQAAKKPKLAKKTYTVSVGKTITVKVKNAVKKAKITWKSSNSKVVSIAGKKNGKNAYVKLKALKAGKVKVTGNYKAGKVKNKLICTVTAKGADSNAGKATTAPTAGNAVESAPTATAAAPAPAPTDMPPTPVPTATLIPFTIINNGAADVTMYIDRNDSEYDGISLIAEAFKADVARVIGVGTDKEGVANESDKGLKVVTNRSALSGKAVIAGTFGTGGNDLVNELIDSGKIDVSAINGKWESYKLQVVENPFPGVSEALVIAGSDKRGTIYGIFHISELMGVSPWVWWADAEPKVQSRVELDGVDVNMTSKEPSVKYRGIFLNDESPSLTTWTDRRYGGRNHKFYNQVFELILRLKGDYLWPAMWGNEFSKDGTDGGASEDTLANARLADQYGVVMGTSHHEPCYRAGNEWGQEFSKYNKGLPGGGSAATWNKYNLPGEEGYNENINAAIEAFWADGVERNKNFDNICTVGMRGEADSSLPAADDPPRYADLLNHIINRQKEILAEAGDTNPTQLVIYKEVEDAWNQGELYLQDCMKDTYAMFCDDNVAYLRTLPTVEQQSMVGGLGMYYHFDYVGAPKSYTWIQTSQISKVWDQMSVAYDYGIDDVWIVNVGDLKPMEYNISYFIDLGYDYEMWGVDGDKKLELYKDMWIEQQLGAGLNKEQLAEAKQLVSDYLDLETSRKVEHVLYNTASNCSDMYSVDNYNEAQDLLIKCNDIMSRTENLMSQVPDNCKAAFYQLVYYPAMAVPNVLKVQIYAALNAKYAGKNLTVANVYKNLYDEALEFDKEIYDRYNNDMPGGPEGGEKWSGMQSAGQKYHIGMQAWDTTSGYGGSYTSNNMQVQVPYPTLETVDGSGESGLNVLVESITNTMGEVYTSGTASLPAFTSVGSEVYTIELANTGNSSYNYTATASADWIRLSKTSGTVNAFDAVQVSVDWSRLSADASGTVTVSDGSNTVTVNVSAELVNTAGLAQNTYVMTNDYIAIDVSHYSSIVNGTGVDNRGRNVVNNMIVVPDNGKYLSSVRTSSSTITYGDSLEGAPYIEYTVNVPESGEYKLQCQFNPTSNIEYDNTKLRYGISVDGGAPEIKNSIVDNYLAGTWRQGTWSADIENNGRKSTTTVSLTAGTHTIRYYQCDPNMGLIRMVLYKDSLSTVYNSPAESYYVGKNVDLNARLEGKKSMYDEMIK